MLAGVALGAPPSSAQALPGQAKVINVACSRVALVTAVQTANALGAAELRLAPGCIYEYLTENAPGAALPIITRNITLVGGPNTTIRRAPTAPTAFRILEVAAGATLRVRGISILNGNTTGIGGGILDAGTVVLEQTTLGGNRAGNGGALGISAGARATVSLSLLNANSTTSVGGGGVINSGTLTVFKSVLAGNSAPVNGGGLNTQSSGVSHLIQSTVDQNTSGSLGGGISNLGTTTLDRALVQRNRGSGGGGIATGNANVIIRNSIIRNNNPDNCNPVNTIPGCVN